MDRFLGSKMTFVHPLVLQKPLCVQGLRPENGLRKKVPKGRIPTWYKSQHWRMIYWKTSSRGVLKYTQWNLFISVKNRTDKACQLAVSMFVNLESDLIMRCLDGKKTNFPLFFISRESLSTTFLGSRKWKSPWGAKLFFITIQTIWVR